MAVELITQLGNYLTTGSVSFIIFVVLEVFALLAIAIMGYFYLFYYNIKIEIERPLGQSKQIVHGFGRIFQKDGVSWLRIRGVKKVLTKPESKFILPNKSLFWKTIITLREDGSVEGYHPVERTNFATTTDADGKVSSSYTPVPVNVMTQFAEEEKDTNNFYQPKPSFWDKYGSLVLNGLTVMISGMVLIIVAMQIADGAKAVANGMHSLSSAISSINAPAVPQ